MLRIGRGEGVAQWIGPLSISPLKMMQPWPEEQSRLKVTIRPFQLHFFQNSPMLIIHSVSFRIDFWKMFGYVFLGSTFFFVFVATAIIKKIQLN